MANNSTVRQKDNMQHPQHTTKNTTGVRVRDFGAVCRGKQVTILMFPLKNVKKSMNLQSVLKKINITRPDVRKRRHFPAVFQPCRRCSNSCVAVASNTKQSCCTWYLTFQKMATQLIIRIHFTSLTIILNDKVQVTVITTHRSGSILKIQRSGHYK